MTRMRAVPLAALAAVSLVSFCVPALADDSARGRAAIASAHVLATEAGFEVIAQGGNAFDAAVAVAATLSAFFARTPTRG